MGKTKKSNKVAAAPKVAAITPDEFLKLTPEEQAAYLNQVAEMQSENAALKVEGATGKKVHTFKVKGTGDNEGKTLVYKFAVPLFHIDKKEYTDAEAVKIPEVCAHLVQIGSGIVKLVEDKNEGGE